MVVIPTAHLSFVIFGSLAISHEERNPRKSRYTFTSMFSFFGRKTKPPPWSSTRLKSRRLPCRFAWYTSVMRQSDSGLYDCPYVLGKDGSCLTRISCKIDIHLYFRL